MKLIKALFGRTALTIFAILLQLLISIALVWLIDIIVTSLIGNIRGIGPYMLSTIIMTAIDIVIAAITTVRIVIRDMSPDEKMSWLVVLVSPPQPASRDTDRASAAIRDNAFFMISSIPKRFSWK